MHKKILFSLLLCTSPLLAAQKRFNEDENGKPFSKSSTCQYLQKKLLDRQQLLLKNDSEISTFLCARLALLIAQLNALQVDSAAVDRIQDDSIRKEIQFTKAQIILLESVTTKKA